jgi:acetyltransferase
MFKYLFKESIYYRLVGYTPKVNYDLLIRFTQIDYDREVAIIAEVDAVEGKKIAGVTRIVSAAWKETAEFAIVVTGT